MRNRSRLTIAGRELAGLRAEKTILLAIGIQLFIAAFSSFLVVGLVSMYDPSGMDGAEVELAVTGEEVERLERAATEVDTATTVRYPDVPAAHEAFDRGSVDAMLVATRGEDGRIGVVATAPDSNIRTTVTVVQIRDVLTELERTERTDRSAYLSETPLALPEQSGSTPYFTFTYTVLVPLLVFLPVFISGSITVDSITEEIDRGTLELLRVAPVTLAEILDGKALAAVAIAPAQAALWLGLLWANGTPIANVVPLLVVTAAFATLVVGIAAAIALFAPDRRAAQFLYSVGIVALFGAASLLPGGPTNVVARLAIDSADAGVFLTVGVYVALAAVAYMGVRTFVRENGIE